MTKNNKGFTLLEIIVIIVVGGIVVAMLVPFMGSALTRSHEPMDNLMEAARLSSDMASVVADHRMGWNPNLPVCSELINEIDEEYEYSKLSQGFPRICHLNSYVFDCNPDNNTCGDNVCLLQVRLEGTKNPGETSTYYFPCQ